MAFSLGRMVTALRSEICNRAPAAHAFVLCPRCHVRLPCYITRAFAHCWFAITMFDRLRTRVSASRMLGKRSAVLGVGCAMNRLWFPVCACSGVARAREAVLGAESLVVELARGAGLPLSSSTRCGTALPVSSVPVPPPRC
jgi:hypothetical protein